MRPLEESHSEIEVAWYLPGAGGWGWGAEFGGYRVPVCKMKSILMTDGGDGFTTM